MSFLYHHLLSTTNKLTPTRFVQPTLLLPLEAMQFNLYTKRSTAIATPAVRAKPDANAYLRPENSNTVSGSAGTFADCTTSVLAGPDPGDGSNCSPSNRANESIIPDENQNQNMILARLGLQAPYSGGVPVNFEQPNTNTVSGDPRTGFAYSVASVISGANSGTEGPNAAAIRPRYDVAGNAIQSTYDALDLDIKPWTPEVGCLVNPQQENINELTPPDEAQRQFLLYSTGWNHNPLSLRQSRSSSSATGVANSDYVGYSLCTLFKKRVMLF